MTISERIFELLAERKISQKDFSQKTGIAQSTISDWKKKGTNPASDKIMVICDVLEVTPYALLTGIDAAGSRENCVDYHIVSDDSKEGELLELYKNLAESQRNRVMGYVRALTEL